MEPTFGRAETIFALWKRSCRQSLWRNFPKAVSHTIERIDHVEGIVDRHKLLAQSLHVTIDRTVVDVNVIGIRRVLLHQ